jgi:hypothetical protein
LKDENETLSFLYEYFINGEFLNKPYKKLLSNLNEIKSKINKRQKELNNRVYFAKVRNDLTIPTKSNRVVNL